MVLGPFAETKGPRPQGGRQGLVWRLFEISINLVKLRLFEDFSMEGFEEGDNEEEDDEDKRKGGQDSASLQPLSPSDHKRVTAERDQMTPLGSLSLSLLVTRGFSGLCIIQCR